MLNNRKEMVKMEDFKERMQQEYAQLKERWEKLKKFNNSKEILSRHRQCKENRSRLMAVLKAAKHIQATSPTMLCLYGYI